MGLTRWANQARGGAPRNGDTVIAKNDPAGDEIEALNRIVTAYLEFAEPQAAEAMKVSRGYAQPTILTIMGPISATPTATNSASVVMSLKRRRELRSPPQPPDLTVTPTAVPRIAMAPISMTVPIASTGVKYADLYAGTNKNGAGPAVQIAGAVGPPVTCRTAATRGIGRRGCAQGRRGA